MKLQHIAILFVLIIVPISLIMASYIQNQIDAITLQTAYDANLINATHDAMKAFQLNTTNNMYSSISDSKMRDIQASVNTFYNSLNTSMAEYAQKAKDLEAYVPAMLFTLYDGYYIYTSFDNIYPDTTNTNGTINIDINKNNKENGLKPYVYYSAKYKLGQEIIVVNYTLDNMITVYGEFGNGYETRSGYLINPDAVNVVDDNTVIYDGVEITPENLKENLLYFDDNDNLTQETFEYVFYNNQKVYLDRTNNRYFWYQNYRKTYVESEEIITELNKFWYNNEYRSNSAYRFYADAREFSSWVNEHLGGITQENLIRYEDGTSELGPNNGRNETNQEGYLSEDTGNEHIFEMSDTNNPLVSDSTFNNHRLAVIRKSIEGTLNTAIEDYRSTSLYDFALPVMTDDDWYSILNNVSMVSFLQGMSIGYRIYNNYAIITNNVNKEVVTTRNIYIMLLDKTNNDIEYHQPGCKDLLTKLDAQPSRYEIYGAYPTASFQRQSVRVGEDSSDDQHYYLQAVDGYTTTGCYNCIVNATADYNIDDIIEGNDLVDFNKTKEYTGAANDEVAFKGKTGDNYSTMNAAYKKVRDVYLKALARERYDIYKTNFDLDASR